MTIIRVLFLGLCWIIERIPAPKLANLSCKTSSEILDASQLSDTFSGFLVLNIVSQQGRAYIP